MSRDSASDGCSACWMFAWTLWLVVAWLVFRLAQDDQDGLAEVLREVIYGRTCSVMVQPNVLRHAVIW